MPTNLTASETLLSLKHCEDDKNKFLVLPLYDADSHHKLLKTKDSPNIKNVITVFCKNYGAF